MEAQLTYSSGISILAQRRNNAKLLRTITLDTVMASCGFRLETEFGPKKTTFSLCRIDVLTEICFKYNL